MGTFGVPIFSDSFSDLRARVFTFKKSGFQSFSDETKNAAISVKITLFGQTLNSSALSKLG